MAIESPPTIGLEDYNEPSLITGLRVEEVDPKDLVQWGAFQEIYEDYEAEIAYPAGAVACRSVAVVKDVLLEDQGIAPRTLAVATMGLNSEGKVIAGSGVIGGWHTLAVSYSVARYAMDWQARETGQATSLRDEFAFARHLNSLVVVDELCPDDYYVDAETGRIEPVKQYHPPTAQEVDRIGRALEEAAKQYHPLAETQPAAA